MISSYLGREFANERAKEFVRHGLCRRLRLMTRCIVKVFDVLPPNSDDVPEPDVLRDVTVHTGQGVCYRPKSISADCRARSGGDGDRTARSPDQAPSAPGPTLPPRPGAGRTSGVRASLSCGVVVCSMQVSTPAAPARGRARNNTRLRAFAESCTRCLSRAKRPSAQWCVSPGCKFGPDRNRRLDTGGAAQSATPYGRLKFSPRSRPSRLRKVTSEGGCSMGVCSP